MLLHLGFQISEGGFPFGFLWVGFSSFGSSFGSKVYEVCNTLPRTHTWNLNKEPVGIVGPGTFLGSGSNSRVSFLAGTSFWSLLAFFKGNELETTHFSGSHNIFMTPY